MHCHIDRYGDRFFFKEVIMLMHSEFKDELSYLRKKTENIRGYL
jgi:hypothetical protein